MTLRNLKSYLGYHLEDQILRPCPVIPSGCFLRCVRVDELVSDERSFADAQVRLPEWRRRKCEAMRFVADRYRSAAAGLLLLAVLEEAGLKTSGLTVRENDFGKPYFPERPEVYFSLSHGGDRVMAAVADRPVGCDVERIEFVDEELMAACLADEERALTCGLSSDEARHEAFFRLWVRKESYVKARGRGWDGGPAAFSVCDGMLPSGWIFQDFVFADGHVASLCLRAREA